MYIIRKFLVLLTLFAVPLAMLTISDASAFPPGEVPHVSCTTISIDPPSWIKVNFYGNIGDNDLDRTADYIGGDVHLATIDISDLMTALGDIPYTVTANGGWLGISPTVTGVLHCHDAPTTTTTTTEPPATTTTTATLVPAAVPPTTSPRPIVDIGAPAPRLALTELPHTGSSSRPLEAFGGALLLVGSGAIALTRNRRRP